ncbi:hypothetical protein [Streptomyces sp. NPDC057939]|uniref:hypothetical protein n=1 Tax=Streptomyces sp. NPDC057939 TaxID=3346284 RepID=UPI0036E55E17
MNGQRGEIGSARPTPEPEAAESPHVPGQGALFLLLLEDGTPEMRAAIDDQLDAVAAWWLKAPPDGPGFRQVEPEHPATGRHDVERFLADSRIREVQAHVPLVLYVTGHGITSGAAMHYAMLRDTVPERLLATGLRTTEIIVAALDSLSQDVLVIVNMCESSDVGSELQAMERDLTHRTRSATLHVMATAGPQRKVAAGAFAAILREAYELLRSSEEITRPFLTMEEFSGALRQATRAINAREGRELEGPRVLLSGKQDVPTATLPNPGYRVVAAAVEPGRQELAPTLEHLDYWLEKASGRTSATDAGWYFFGRRPLNEELASFLRGPAAVMVVTGIAASGKSAILGRAVTLSDESFRRSNRFEAAVLHCPPETVPDEGSVTVAVTAHNRDPLDLLRAVAVKLGATADPSGGTDALRRWQAGLSRFLQTPGPMVTVVVDSLDEANDPVGCVRNVLVPLAGHRTAHGTRLDHVPAQPAQATPKGRGVRLVIAVRSSSPADDMSRAGHISRAGDTFHGDGVPLGPDSEHELLSGLKESFPEITVLRTDLEEMREDIAGYVRALLDGEETWRGQDLGEVSQVVAAAVGRSFLDARVAAEQLRTGGPVLLGDAWWLDRLNTGTVGLLAADLDRVAEDGLGGEEALALLRATAFGLGRGIPWGEVWPAMAAVLLERPLEGADEKIRTLLGGRLSGYLTHDSEDDRRVYRPAHDRLAAVLRRWPTGGAVGGGGNGSDSRP